MSDESSQRTRQERAIALAITSIDGVTDDVVDGLTEEFGTAMAISEVSQTELQKVDGIGPSISRDIFRRSRKARNRPEIARELYGGESGGVRRDV